MFQIGADDRTRAANAWSSSPDSSLAQHLVAASLISAQDADRAIQSARRLNVDLADTLIAEHGVSQYSIAAALAAIHRTPLITPILQHPETTLIAHFGAARCLRNRVLPWRQANGATIILIAKPVHFKQQSADLETAFGPLRMALTTSDQIDRTIMRHFGSALVMRAESRVPAQYSCRGWRNRVATLSAGAALVTIAVLGLMAPKALMIALIAWAMLTLTLNTMLRAIAAYLGFQKAPQAVQGVTPAHLPKITMLVPLYNETAIANHLMARLRTIDYPRALLDICLVLEADDETTRTTLDRTSLPPWMRAIVVPAGTIKTKPRALNYALDFARGSIIGVWDAEDAPATDQLRAVAHHFANCEPRVACLQGRLDYYNPETNWLTRCFTLEYASWFRVILPCLQRLNLVLPLGGTTLFFRRRALEDLGGWDAHNVTEDADLGVRLARRGYRTELIPTVTEEEANGRAWPWVKQRSRWLKGYVMTYGVHMRNPAALWRDLGAWRFFGLQLLFLGTLSQIALAPLLWSFWLLPFGFAHPFASLLPSWGFWCVAGLFITSEIVGLIVAALGVRKAGKTWLIKWAITLQCYFPLATLAIYKGLWELLTKPFYWDKTDHGILLPPRQITPASAVHPPRRHPASDV